MRLVVFSDLHAHPYSQFATALPGGRNSRLQAVLDVVKEITQFVQEHDVDVVVFLGDLHHARTKIDVDVFSSTFRAMERLSRSVKHLIMLVGNHDQYVKTGEIHSLEVYREFATVIDQPVIEDIEVGSEHLRFAAHPFTTDIESWLKFTRMLPRGLDFFFMHQGITEGTFGAYDISIKAEVNFADLPLDKAAYVLAGHNHKHQWIGQRVAYAGSPLQHSFSERTEAKGFLYFEDDLYAPPQFIRTEQAPSFMLLEDREAFERELHEDNVFARWHYVRFKTGKKEDADWVMRCFPRVQVELTREGTTEERRVDKEALQSDRALLQTYIDESVNGVGSAKLLEMGLELMARGEE